jgi:hypothetical protein
MMWNGNSKKRPRSPAEAGALGKYLNLEDVGIRGNGHQFMSEKNGAEISKFFMDWLEKNVQ